MVSVVNIERADAWARQRAAEIVEGAIALPPMDLLVGALIFLPFLTVIIAIHELGHFISARKFGMKVTEYFVGFGPWKIWSRRKGELEYGVKPIFVGGYVKIAGMNPFGEPAGGHLALRFQADLAARDHDRVRPGHALRGRGGDLRGVARAVRRSAHGAAPLHW